MAVFIGTFENKVDKKGRVSIPAPFRSALANQEFQGVIAFPSRRADCLEGCGNDLMESLVNKQSADDLLSDAPPEAPPQIFFSLRQLPFDGDGRVSLPKEFCDKAGITDRATFVGVGKFFQIWEPARLDAYVKGGGK